MLPSASQPLAFSHLCSQSHSIIFHCDSGGHCLLQCSNQSGNVTLHQRVSAANYNNPSLVCLHSVLTPCLPLSITATELPVLCVQSSYTLSSQPLTTLWPHPPLPAWPELSLSFPFLQRGERTLDPSQVRAEAVPGGPPPVGRSPGAAAATRRGGRWPEVGGAAAGTWHQGGG